MKPITTAGMYAMKIGITQAITGPIAASSSPRHTLETFRANNS